MRVHDATTEIHSAAPDTTNEEAAMIMLANDVGALPAVERTRLAGMVTDRDIAMRAVAAGLRPDRSIREIMASGVQRCHSAEELERVLDEMGEQKIRRMPVLSAEGAVVGMLSLGDIVCIDDDFRSIGRALRDICTPHGLHSQASPQQA